MSVCSKGRVIPLFYARPAFTLTVSKEKELFLVKSKRYTDSFKSSLEVAINQRLSLHVGFSNTDRVNFISPIARSLLNNKN